MDKKEKLLKQIAKNIKNIDFKKLKKLLENYDYECINTGGSHFVFRKENCQSITIPFNRPIKVIYVKKVLQILEINND